MKTAGKVATDAHSFDLFVSEQQLQFDEGMRVHTSYQSTIEYDTTKHWKLPLPPSRSSRVGRPLAPSMHPLGPRFGKEVYGQQGWPASMGQEQLLIPPLTAQGPPAAMPGLVRSSRPAARRAARTPAWLQSAVDSPMATLVRRVRRCRCRCPRSVQHRSARAVRRQAACCRGSRGLRHARRRAARASSRITHTCCHRRPCWAATWESTSSGRCCCRSSWTTCRLSEQSWSST